jgi:hypothetical protein
LFRVVFAVSGLAVAPCAGAQTAQPSKPYQNLFKGDELKAAAERALARAQADQAGAAHNCTMRIIPVDPAADSKMRVGPDTSETRHTLRVIPPPCKSSLVMPQPQNRR